MLHKALFLIGLWLENLLLLNHMGTRESSRIEEHCPYHPGRDNTLINENMQPEQRFVELKWS